jgi:hypothetical protein
MAEWHWYCDQHGQIDRTVQVRQQGTRAEGRCRTCGAKAISTERATVETEPGEQLGLFGDRT